MQTNNIVNNFASLPVVKDGIESPRRYCREQ